ncbi:glutamate mutase L [Aggregatilineales bacterium SYSU G02658]
MTTRSGSILAADFGSVTTRVLLFDLVNGEYQLVARRDTLTTFDVPHDDVALALRRVLRDMGTAMGRRFLDNRDEVITPEDEDRSGVDLFVTSASVGRPMRVLMVNVVPEASYAAALRAISGSYVEVVGRVVLTEQPTVEDQLNAVLQARPDLIFFAGGVDGGPREALLRLARGLKLALNIIDRASRPILLYAGNADVAPTIADIFNDLTETIITNNVLPAYGQPNPQPAVEAIAAAYNRYQERVGEGFNAVTATSSSIIPTAQTYELMARFFGLQTGQNVLIADVGSASTLLYAVVGGQLYSRISSQHGVGHSAHTLLEAVGVEAIRAWLPFNVTRSELDHFARNKALLPASIPMTLRDGYLEHAFLRAGVRQLLGELSAQWGSAHGSAPFPLIFAAGSALTRSGKPGYNLLLIADSVQPLGVSQVYADPFGVLTALGSIARVDALPAVQIIDSGNVELLGTLISLEGQPTTGRTAARLTIKTGGERIKYNLEGGQVLFLPLPVDFEMELTIVCTGRMRVNGRRRLNLKVQGGTAGVMIDARGRPLAVGQTVQERAQRLPRWVHAATDDPLHEIPQEWLAPVTEEAPSQAVALTKMTEPPRRLRRGRRAQPPPAQELPDEADLSDVLAGDGQRSKLAKGGKDDKAPQPAAPFVDDDDVRSLF